MLPAEREHGLQGGGARGPLVHLACCPPFVLGAASTVLPLGRRKKESFLLLSLERRPEMQRTAAHDSAGSRQAPAQCTSPTYIWRRGCSRPEAWGGPPRRRSLTIPVPHPGQTHLQSA